MAVNAVSNNVTQLSLNTTDQPKSVSNRDNSFNAQPLPQVTKPAEGEKVVISQQARDLLANEAVNNDSKLLTNGMGIEPPKN